jgi:hypothetical protein
MTAREQIGSLRALLTLYGLIGRQPIVIERAIEVMDGLPGLDQDDFDVAQQTTYDDPQLSDASRGLLIARILTSVTMILPPNHPALTRYTARINKVRYEQAKATS